jgi:hypothetical protein
MVDLLAMAGEQLDFPDRPWLNFDTGHEDVVSQGLIVTAGLGTGRDSE